jgi:hypothetical protein
VAAVLCLETVGPQPRRWTLDELLARYAESYGGPLAAPLAERLRAVPDPAAESVSPRGVRGFSLLD